MAKAAAKRNRTYHNPSGGPTCGDRGGVNRLGEPCEYAAGWGTDHSGSGRCCFHEDDSKEARREVVKDMFVHFVEDGRYTVTEAANKVGYDYSTLFRWRKVDPDFDAAVAAAMTQGEEVRNRMVEDTLYRRIMEERATAQEMTLYLTSRTARFSRTGMADEQPPSDDSDAMLSAREKLENRLAQIRSRLAPSSPQQQQQQQQQSASTRSQATQAIKSSSLNGSHSRITNGNGRKK